MIAVLVQARMGSSRLPGKVMMPVEGEPLIMRVLERVQRAQAPDLVALVTGSRQGNADLCDFVASRGIPVFCGSDDDVLERYFFAAHHFNVDTVVRVTGDCPLIDPVVLDDVVDLFLKTGLDYASNVHNPTFPDGLDVEVISLAALERAHLAAKLPSEREHVTPYIWKNPALFRQANLESPADLSAMRWCVDDDRDLEFVRSIYRELLPIKRDFGMRDIQALLTCRPELVINSDTQRNEGYALSLNNDRGETKMDQLNLEKSRKAWKQALDLIPTGTQMMSKTPGQFVEEEYPFYVQSGKGCRLCDLDGNQFIDTFSAFGTVLLGYADEGVNAAIRRQLEDGIIFSIPHILEARVANLLRELVPCAEMSRFFKTGSEATTAAIRLARALTGRTLIAKSASGYHGWHDWHAAGTPRKAGIPKGASEQILTFPYNDIDAAEELFRTHPAEIACIILEPVVLDEPKPGFLERLRDLAKREGALLIFDEIVSGLRFAPGGAQAYYGVTPDLATFGKAMANGMPLSALCGQQQFMKRLEQPDVFVSSTFGGETISLAAAEHVLSIVKNHTVSDAIWERGHELQRGLNAAAQEFDVPLTVNGLPPRMTLAFAKAGSASEAEVRTFFLRECVRRGALFGNVILLNAAHSTADIDALLTAARQAMCELKDALRQGSLQRQLAGKIAAAAFNPRGN